MTATESNPDSPDGEAGPEETAAATTYGAGDDQTEFVPPPTQPAPEFAWSIDEDDEDDDDVDTSWRAAATAVSVPLFILAAVTAIAVAVGATVVMVRDDRAPAPAPIPAPTSTIPAAALPPITSSPVPPPSTSTAVPNPRPLRYDSRGVPMLPDDATPEEQQVLAAILNHSAIPYNSPIAAAIDAQSVCDWLGHGHYDGGDLFGRIQRTHPNFTDDQVAQFAGASLGVYCRQYGYLLNQTGGDATS